MRASDALPDVTCEACPLLVDNPASCLYTRAGAHNMQTCCSTSRKGFSSSITSVRSTAAMALARSAAKSAEPPTSSTFLSYSACKTLWLSYPYKWGRWEHVPDGSLWLPGETQGTCPDVGCIAAGGSQKITWNSARSNTVSLGAGPARVGMPSSGRGPAASTGLRLGCMRLAATSSGACMLSWVPSEGGV